MKYLKSIILSGLACILMTHTSFAQTYYVNTDLLNVRNEPISGQVVEQLKRGEPVEIYTRSDNWVNISNNPTMPKWISSNYLCDYEDCYLDSSFGQYSQPKDIVSYVNSTPSTKKVSKKTSKSTQSYSYGGSCPCSGVFNCTGSRGGQYCITSGGNKRYR
ncbi:SH3 domain-containing protein [Moraxella boevrei]|uniref:SH3 domain-containing protein n=1 Tax=Faucicola boevrei TaxID=346665 RepID=UPI003735F5B6